MDDWQILGISAAAIIAAFPKLIKPFLEKAYDHYKHRGRSHRRLTHIHAKEIENINHRLKNQANVIEKHSEIIDKNTLTLIEHEKHLIKNSDAITFNTKVIDLMRDELQDSRKETISILVKIFGAITNGKNK